MNVSKKKFHVDNSYLPKSRPFGLFYLQQICDLACSDDYEVPEHGHSGYEISYIVSGEGIFARNGIPYKVNKGMLFLISINDTHYIRSSKENPLRYFCMCINFNKRDPRYPQYHEIEKFFDTFDNPVVMDAYDVYGLFTSALNEMADFGEMSETLMENYFSEILIFTYRSFKHQKVKNYFSSLKIDTTKKFIYEIISCIDSDLTHFSNLQSLSDKLGYSYAYMSSVFSDVMGETIKSYYTRRRFEKAAEMLLEGLSIADIAEKLGYKTVYSFSRAFRSYYGMPPGTYKSTQSNSNRLS